MRCIFRLRFRMLRFSKPGKRPGNPKSGSSEISVVPYFRLAECNEPMTLQDLLDALAAHPFWMVGFFAGLPLLAWLTGLLAGEDAMYSPWNYLFTFIIYAACVPGLFSLTLTAYLFLFESRSILETDLYTQVLPIASMILTLPVVKRQVDLDYVPGFHRLSGLIAMILAALILMWIADRMRFIAFTYMPVQYVLLIFFGLLILLYWGAGRVFGSPYRSQR